MYITITKQELGADYSQSVSDFATYLEKENEGKSVDDMEYFFNQYDDKIDIKEVIEQIDKNTYKLKKTDPKFYSITINPSPSERKRLQNSSKELKQYTRELMKDYAASFYRDQAVSVDDIKYYAKIEHQRAYTGKDIQIQENQPFATKILQLKNDVSRIEQGKQEGNIRKLNKKITKLEKEAPHQSRGFGSRRIVRGMPKEGSQSHIHIIVSRMDITNRYSVSPGSKYKASEVMMHGETVKRGFDRDKFFTTSEKTFDKLFAYKRNYVETYTARKTLLKNPKLYFSILSGLPTNEKAIANKILAKYGVPMMSIPTNKVQLVIKAIKKIKQGLDKAIHSGSIGI
jgi:hypothetical protein